MKLIKDMTSVISYERITS